MCDKFLLEESSIFLKLEKYNNDTTLFDYIKQYIKTLKAFKKQANELGVKNLNKFTTSLIAFGKAISSLLLR